MYVRISNILNNIYIVYMYVYMYAHNAIRTKVGQTDHHDPLVGLRQTFNIHLFNETNISYLFIETHVDRLSELGIRRVCNVFINWLLCCVCCFVSYIYIFRICLCFVYIYMFLIDL